MAILTPDQLHAAIGGQIVTMNPHPRGEPVALLTADESVINAIRSLPNAPPLWYVPSDGAYYVALGRATGLAESLRAFGATLVLGELRADKPGVRYYKDPNTRARLPYPPWCGECHEPTRLRMVADRTETAHETAARCPRCHPMPGRGAISG